MFSLFNLKSKSKYWSESVIRPEYDDLQGSASRETIKMGQLNFTRVGFVQKIPATDTQIQDTETRKTDKGKSDESTDDTTTMISLPEASRKEKEHSLQNEIEESENQDKRSIETKLHQQEQSANDHQKKIMQQHTEGQTIRQKGSSHLMTWASRNRKENGMLPPPIFSSLLTTVVKLLSQTDTLL